VVSAGFNILALHRAGKTLGLAERTYQRTEQRYQADRVDAYHDSLRDALIEVSIAVATWNLANAWYVKLLKDVISGNSKPGPAQDQDVEKQRPAARDVYRTVKAAEFLTADERLTQILARIEQRVLTATKLVESHGLTVVGVLGAEKEFRKLRAQAADAASELLEVAKQVIPPRESPALGPSASPGDDRRTPG
jgi:hypothetical protein